MVFAARLAKLAGRVDLDDRWKPAGGFSTGDTRWTVVRGSDLEDGDS